MNIEQSNKEKIEIIFREIDLIRRWLNLPWWKRLFAKEIKFSPFYDEK